tara:strand:- start:3246 stop:3998 length:753 start_codon:yes stop_codon:yes gene_type:complete
MEKILYKKSYRLNTLKPVKYNNLLGKKGVFSTIRVLGKKNKYILLNMHLKNLNLSLKKMHIDFRISKKLLLKLLNPVPKYIKNYDVLLRIAINSNIISISLRKRLKPYKNFTGTLFPYQRPIPNLKNLYYKKTIKILKSINSQKEEGIFYKNNLLLEGCTTNIVCINNNKIFIPKKNYYSGITMNYLFKMSKRSVNKTNISLSALSKYDEILLIGSGKGVVSLSSIPQIKWKSQSNLVYKEFLNLYQKVL